MTASLHTSELGQRRITEATPLGRLLTTTSPESERDETRHSSLPAYRAARDAGPVQVRRWIADAGVRGRGGAWFPLARKWEVAAGASGDPVVVVNGAEDEPGSHKDRLLMREQPHLVIDGALASAVAVRASTVLVYVNESASTSVLAMREAVARALPTVQHDGLHVKVIEAPAAYVAGEDSAAVEFVESGTAQPRAKPPFPAEAGLHGRPTVVSNVETVAHVAQVVRHGVAWFRALGTSEAPGTMLVTVPGACRRPGVYEVAIGTPLRDLLESAGGVIDGPVRAVQVGGPAAGWIDDLDVRLDPESVAAAGSMLGCGALRMLTSTQCGVAAAAAVAEFFAAESCGKCPPCRMSTQFHARALGGLASGAAVTAAQLDKAVELSTLSLGGTDCALARFPIEPLRSARILFRDDFERHLDGEPCGRDHEREPLTIGG